MTSNQSNSHNKIYQVRQGFFELKKLKSVFRLNQLFLWNNQKCKLINIDVQQQKIKFIRYNNDNSICLQIYQDKNLLSIYNEWEGVQKKINSFIHQENYDQFIEQELSFQSDMFQILQFKDIRQMITDAYNMFEEVKFILQ